MKNEIRIVTGFEVNGLDIDDANELRRLKKNQAGIFQLTPDELVLGAYFIFVTGRCGSGGHFGHATFTKFPPHAISNCSVSEAHGSGSPAYARIGIAGVKFISVHQISVAVFKSHRSLIGCQSPHAGNGKRQYHNLVSHLCHESLCCHPDHLTVESYWNNQKRNTCRASGVCICQLTPRCIMGLPIYDGLQNWVIKKKLPVPFEVRIEEIGINDRLLRMKHGITDCDAVITKEEQLQAHFARLNGSLDLNRPLPSVEGLNEIAMRMLHLLNG